MKKNIQYKNFVGKLKNWGGGGGKKKKIGNRNVTIFKKGEYEIIKKESSIDALKETWASGTVLKNNASGKYFGDYLAPRTERDGLEVLYKVDGIGEDGLGYRYFTGPKKEGAIRGKFYSGVPLSRIEEMNNSGGSIKYKGISNFYDFSDSFGNCRHEGGVELRGGKKPEILLKRIIEISTKKGEIVLDYHLGTGGGVAVAHKMGRPYIGIEQLDYGKNDSVVRLNNVIKGEQSGISKTVNWQGGGEFVYCELTQHNANIIDKIEHARTTETLKAIWHEIENTDFISYKIKPETINKNIHEFADLSIAEQKQFLIAVLDKNQLYVNYSEIDDADYQISEEDKKLNKQFYGG